MAEVFLCEWGQLDVKSKRALKAAGIVVVEVDDPGKCQFIRSTEIVSGDDMLWACMDALRQRAVSYSDDKFRLAQMDRLASNLFKLVITSRAEKGQVVNGGSEES